MQHATALNQMMMMMMDNKEWFYSKKTAFFGTFSMNYLDPAPSCIYHQGGLSYEAQPSVLTGNQLTRPGPGTQSAAPAKSRDQASVGDETGAGTELSLVNTQQLIDIHVSKLPGK